MIASVIYLIATFFFLTSTLLPICNAFQYQARRYCLMRTDTDLDGTKTRPGHAHTEESRAKISAANKGKLPWNAGLKHDEETRQLIAEKTRIAMKKKKQERADALGLTLEEYDLRKKQIKKEKQQSKSKGGLTDEGRKRISESMKKRWEDPEYKAQYALRSKGNRNHSSETRAKISEAIKLKWQDEEYRSKIGASPSEDVRARISSTLKARWEEPSFREKMARSMSVRDEEWRTKMSEKIRALWENDTYRNNVVEGWKSSNKSSAPSHRVRPPRKVRSPEEKLRLKLHLQEQRREKQLARSEAIKLAKKAKKDLMNRQSLKELLGRELWFEEKMKRRKDGDAALLNDEELESALTKKWEEEENGDGDDTLTEDIEMDEWELDSNEMDDVIEVYDEDGELVSTYTAQEYGRLKAAKQI